MRVPNGRHLLELFKDAVREGGVCVVCLDRNHANRSRRATAQRKPGDVDVVTTKDGSDLAESHLAGRCSGSR